MNSQSSGGLGLPKYQRTPENARRVNSERATAKLIQSLWKAAGKSLHSDPKLLRLLVQCGWTNVLSDHKGVDSTREWRNRNIAEYLKKPYRSEAQLVEDLSLQFKTFSPSKWKTLLLPLTGITHYYGAFRKETLDFVSRRSVKVSLAFQRVSASSPDKYKKIGDVASIIESLGQISAARRHVSPFNALTPALLCLDPDNRFPIMNKRTVKLLRWNRSEPDADGLVLLSKFIGPTYDVRNAFELDVYSLGEGFPTVMPKRNRTVTSGKSFSDVGLKSEINSTAELAAKTVTIRKRHNKLINDLSDYLLWRHTTLKQSRFDGLVLGWKDGRDLLIEAKTESEGAAGRMQIRQAIGQLYDYQFTHMPNNKVDLAVLLRKEPSRHVKDLLATLKIELLWFKGKMLTGTIQL